MVLSLILALMTVAAVCSMIWPLVRRAGSVRSGSDVAVYRDQLDEVERDLAAGLIGKTEAEAARVEISRRLLAAADTAEATPPAADAVSAAWRRRAVAIGSLLTLPILAGGLYLRLGSPDLAAEKPAVQSSALPAEQSIESLVAKVEAHLKRNPEDGRGWEILAPVYMRLDRYSDSVSAWRNTLQLLGESAEREANLGEALTAEADGVVTADAKAAFVRATTLEPTIVSARYYLGLSAEQDGQREKAAKILRDLIAQAPAGAFWVGEVRNALARVESTSSPPPPGPSAAQMAAAATETPAQQTAMIQSMVDRLAARLKQDGSDVDSWVRLVRSYKVLGETEKARAAATDARQALAGEPAKLQRLNAALEELDANTAASPVAAPGSAPSAAVAGAAPDHPQGATIQDMVVRLTERLKVSGSDPEGWVTLVRSYATLGEKDKATAAIASARLALAGDPDQLQQFNNALKQFNISE